MRTTVLFVCEGIQHLSSAIALAKNLRQADISSSLFYAHDYPTNPECRVFKHILNDIMIVPGYLQHVGLVLFFTNESSPFCMSSIRVGFIAKRTGTPTITVQHGWIQPGLNFQTNLPKVGFLGRGTDSSTGLSHFSPVITYFGENGIGYPLGTDAKTIEFPHKENINVLISTNLNWNVYSRENIISFMRALMHLKQEFPFLKFMHRPHPAENPQAIALELGMYMGDFGISSGPWDNISDAIDWADLVISTPSTVVLDSYFKGKPTYVYRFDGFDMALSQAKNISFNSGKEIATMIGSLLGQNKYPDPGFAAFKKEVFESIVKQQLATAQEFFLDEADYLQYRIFCRS